ncbi:MAG: rRNA maturation RNase YbeY [Alicyclobacillus sp.]|nr:rRNA maturation RNase YbeY [Alicyclobacillus sp.]
MTNEPRGGKLTVDLDVRTRLPEGEDLGEAFVRRVLEAAAVHLGEWGEVSVSLVGDEEIHQLNREYRGVDRPTDVLSFPLLEGEEDPEPMVPGQPRLLGDIVVSVPTAVRQADAYGHSLQRELGFLLVHGFLHLLGFDHADEASEREMFALQEQVLAGVGLSRESAGAAPPVGRGDEAGP